MTIEEMKDRLKPGLKHKRFVHSVNVMETSILLARKYGVEEEKAAVAGLLHDCARDIKGERVFKLCDELGIETDYITRTQPELLHGPIGARLAETEYGIADAEILDAIRYHTTGCERMSMLAKIVFIADYIEPGRTFPAVFEARKVVYNDIDKAILMSLEKTVRFVMDKGTLVHPNTINARNYIIYERRSKAK